MLAKGPACTITGVPSSVCMSVGWIASCTLRRKESARKGLCETQHSHDSYSTHFASPFCWQYP